MNWFLDSSICINCLRGKTPLVKTVLQKLDPLQIKIPSMVMAELLHGAEKSADRDRNRNLVSLFLAPFEVVAFDGRSADTYAHIRSELERQGKVIGFNDMIIAATAMAHDGAVVSGNIKDFSRIAGLRVENWSEVSL